MKVETEEPQICRQNAAWTPIYWGSVSESPSTGALSPDLREGRREMEWKGRRAIATERGQKEKRGNGRRYKESENIWK